MKRFCAIPALMLFAGTSASAADSLTRMEWKVDVFAAVAPCAASAKPVLHMAGENDPLVRFAWRQRTIDEVRKINGCGEGKPWGEHCTMYPSKGGTPVVTYIHPGGCQFPQDVPPIIVKFFKEQAKP